MPATWPAELPQFAYREGFSVTKQNTNIRTEVETGPIKNRRRFTTPQIQFAVTMWLTTTQFEVLETFFDVTLLDGSDTFFFDHPITGDQYIVRFIDPYITTPLGGVNYRVNMNWESVPNA